jgi:hypothetical protein
MSLVVAQTSISLDSGRRQIRLETIRVAPIGQVTSLDYRVTGYSTSAPTTG